MSSQTRELRTRDGDMSFCTDHRPTPAPEDARRRTTGATGGAWRDGESVTLEASMAGYARYPNRKLIQLQAIQLLGLVGSWFADLPRETRAGLSGRLFGGEGLAKFGVPSADPLRRDGETSASDAETITGDLGRLDVSLAFESASLSCFLNVGICLKLLGANMPGRLEEEPHPQDDSYRYS